jgi:hypothetical protein
VYSNETAFGNMTTDNRSNRLASDPVFIPNGKTIILKGVVKTNPLFMDGCYYSDSSANNDSVIGDIHGGGTSSSDIYQIAPNENNEIVFKNTFGSNYYFRFGFKGQNDSILTPASEYSPLQYIIV